MCDIFFFSIFHASQADVHYESSAVTDDCWVILLMSPSVTRQIPFDESSSPQRGRCCALTGRHFSQLVINYIPELFKHASSEQLLSECESIHNAHNYYVPNGGSDGDPEPNGIPGHGLGLLMRTVSCHGCSVDTGRRVEQRVVGAIVIIGR